MPGCAILCCGGKPDPQLQRKQSAQSARQPPEPADAAPGYDEDRFRSTARRGSLQADVSGAAAAAGSGAGGSRAAALHLERGQR